MSVNIDKIDAIMNKYPNTYHKTLKMKPAHAKSRTYIESNKENNKEDPNFEVSGPVIISKNKNYFCKRLQSKLVSRSFYDSKS